MTNITRLTEFTTNKTDNQNKFRQNNLYGGVFFGEKGEESIK